MIFGHFRYIWGRCYVWYTSDVWYSNASNIVLHTTHHPWWVLVHLVHFITCDIWYTTPLSTPRCFLVHFWHTRMIFGHFQYACSGCCVWYTSDVWYSNASNIVFTHYTSSLESFSTFGAFYYMWRLVHRLVHYTNKYTKLLFGTFLAP